MRFCVDVHTKAEVGDLLTAMHNPDMDVTQSVSPGPQMDAENRRVEPRTDTAFFAVELRGRDLHYRLVRNISASGFSFDDRFPLERPGDPIIMEFPLPGSRDPIRVAGRVVYARPDRGVGVRIE